MMSEDDKRLLQKKAPDLMKTLDLNSSTLLAELGKRSVITHQQKEVIQCKEGNGKQVEALVDILLKGDEDAMDKFIYALVDSGHSGVAETYFRPPQRDDFTDRLEGSVSWRRNESTFTVPVVRRLSLKTAEDFQVAVECERHVEAKNNWFCKTCTQPTCSECVREDHEYHDTEELDTAADHFKQDLANVSKMSVKRLATLKQLSAELESSKLKMEETFDKANQQVADAADDMRSLITNHEQMVQVKLNQARETARKRMAKLREELNIALENTSILLSSANSERDVAVNTVLEASNIKQQFLDQGFLPIPSADFAVVRRNVRPRDLIPTSNFVGQIETSISVDSQAWVKVETGNLGTPIQTLVLDYTGWQSVCGIAPIHRTLICVAHGSEPCIWVYSTSGQLVRKLSIPSIKGIFGMVTLNKRKGRVAVVDGSRREVHIVTLSEDLEVVQHTTKAVPIAPGRISINQNKQLTVNHTGLKRIVTLYPDGQLLSDFQVSIPHKKVSLQCVAQTRSGFVITDRENKQVYFTDAKGSILCTSNDWNDPRFAVQTSWGHVLIADYTGHEVKAFGERGDFLGNVHDVNGPIMTPHDVHVDEEEGLVYVARGGIRNYELRTYKFVPSDLPSLPLQRSTTKLTVNVKLANV